MTESVRAKVASKKVTLSVLSRRIDFLETFRSGRRIKPAEWIVFNFSIKPPSPGSFRCGWTLPKAVGIAVIRNRLKRWTRDWLKKRLAAAVLKAGSIESSEIPAVDLNIGFRPMPKGFYLRLKRVEFDQVMEKGWCRLVAVTK